MKTKIYVEGGAKGRLATVCRKGFSELFRRAGFAGCMPRIVSSGSRQSAFRDFCTAVANREDDCAVFLLVDSEDAVPANTDAWRFLFQRQADRWEKPARASDDSAHLMVQCMESWFLSDLDALTSVFGREFRRDALADRNDIERIPKQDVLESLKRATKGGYDKGRHSFRILELLDPQKLQQASPYAKRLFETLKRA